MGILVMFNPLFPNLLLINSNKKSDSICWRIWRSGGRTMD